MQGYSLLLAAWLFGGGRQELETDQVNRTHEATGHSAGDGGILYLASRGGAPSNTEL